MRYEPLQANVMKETQMCVPSSLYDQKQWLKSKTVKEKLIKGVP